MKQNLDLGLGGVILGIRTGDEVLGERASAGGDEDNL